MERLRELTNIDPDKNSFQIYCNGMSKELYGWGYFTYSNCNAIKIMIDRKYLNNSETCYNQIIQWNQHIYRENNTIAAFSNYYY